MSVRARPEYHTSEGLFLRLLPQSAQRENTFTEMFAAVLQADAKAADAYWRLITATLPSKIREARGSIEVESQVSLPVGVCFDMVLYRGEYGLVLEHKLGAPLGPNQLERYIDNLRGEFTHLALVADTRLAVPPGVLLDRRYARPEGREHFRWAAFDVLLGASAARGYADAARMRTVFAELGLGPAHRLLPSFGAYGSEEWLKYDKIMCMHLQPLAKALEAANWEWVGSSIRFDRTSEIYATGGPSPLLPEVRLNPLASGTALVIVLKTTSQVKRGQLVRNLDDSKALSAWPGASRRLARPLYRSERATDWHVELRLPWDSLLLRTRKRAYVAGRIKTAVLSIMRAADPACLPGPRVQQGRGSAR